MINNLFIGTVNSLVPLSKHFSISDVRRDVGLEKIAALISKVQFKNINVQFTEMGHILDRSADLSSR